MSTKNQSADGSLSRSYGLAFFVLFMSLGSLAPYYSLYFRQLGLTGTQIAVISITVPMTRMAIPLLTGFLADTSIRRTTVYRVAAFGAAAAAPGFFFATGFWGLLVVMFVYAVFRSPMISILNSIVLENSSPSHPAFGRIRAWGSIGFVAGTGVAAFWTERFGLTRLPDAIVLGLAVNFLLSWILPDPAYHQAAAERPLRAVSRAAARESVVRLLRDDRFWAFSLALLAVRTSEGGYNLLYSVHLADLGLRPSDAGLMWTIGVVAEILLMAFGGRALGRFRATTLFGISIAVSAIRWWGISVAQSYPALIALQLLHAATFGLFYLAAVEIVAQLATSTIPATGQSLLDAIGFGLAGATGPLLAGPVYDAYGGAAMFAVCAVVAAAGLVPAIALMALDRKEPLLIRPASLAPEPKT